MPSPGVPEQEARAYGFALPLGLGIVHPLLVGGVAVILEQLTSHDAAGIGAMAATFGSPVAFGEVVFRFSRSIAKEEGG